MTFGIPVANVCLDEKKGNETLDNEKKTKASDSEESQNTQVVDIVDDVSYKEYSLNSFPFIVHSQVFKTMLVDNNKNRNNNGNMSNDKNVKIVLKDLDIETFEYIRDYVYGLKPKLNKNNIFKILMASIKYMIDSCID